MRINRVESARASKDSRTCGECHGAIEVGDSYVWIKFRFGGKRMKHTRCGSFRPSEMTSSDKLSRLYGAQESIEDILTHEGDADDVRAALSDAASEAREVGEEYRESAQNIEDGFGTRTSQCDEIEEKADECDSWADTLESAADDIEDFDEDAAEQEVREEAEQEALTEMLSELEDGMEEGVEFPAVTTLIEAEDIDGFDTEVYERRVEEAVEKLVEEKRQEWLDEVRSQADDACSSLSL